MKTSSRVFVGILLLASLVGLQAQIVTTSPPVAVLLDVRVPSILRISVDSSRNNTLQLVGFHALKGTDVDHSSGRKFFEIKEKEYVDLGLARLFANISGAYSIAIRSLNDGRLLDDEGKVLESVSYSFIIDGVPLPSQGGLFEYATAGKSKQGGTLLSLGIEIGPIPSDLPSGIYTDRLAFSVTAR